MKSMTARGILIGWFAFLVFAMIAYVTPARVPVLMLAGRDYAMLRLHLQARQQAVETLQPRGAAVNRAQDRAPALTRARTGTSDVEARMRDWRKLNSSISPFGFISWLSDLWPWLLGLGLALPVLGGLIGAQVTRRVRVEGSGSGFPGVKSSEGSGSGKRGQTDSPQDSGMWGVRHPPVPEPTPTPPKVSGGTTEIPNPLPQTRGRLTAESPGPVSESTPETTETPRPSDPASWNWSARPAARTTPSRPKPPPVKSPHGEKSEE